MANQITQITFGEVELVAVDADPSTGGGLSVDDIGSISVLGTHTDAMMWLYYGGSATSWRRVMAMADNSALTLGVVPYINSSGNLAQDTNHFWDSTNHRLGIGLTAPLGSIHVASTADASLILERANSGTSSAAISLRTERGSIASPTTLVNGDWTGKIDFNGYDGTSYQVGARIIGITNGTIATGSVPTDMAFYTGPGGASTVENLRISNAGSIITAGTGTAVVRDTNAGADVVEHMIIDPSNSLTAGNSYAFDSTAMDFARSNGTRRIVRAMIGLVDTSDTAGSEQGGLAFSVQSAGAAAAEKVRIDHTGKVGIGTTGPATLLDVNGVARMQALAPYFTTQATANTTTSLTSSSNTTQAFTGSTTGQILKFPDATTLQTGHMFFLINDSTASIALQDNGGNAVKTLINNSVTIARLLANGTANGSWSVQMAFDNQQQTASSSTTTTTTGTSDGALSGMSISPTVGGTYLAIFTANATNSNNGTTVTFSLYANAVQDTPSIQTIAVAAGASLYVSSTHSVVTIAANQAIAVEWHTSANTASCFGRRLTVTRIG